MENLACGAFFPSSSFGDAFHMKFFILSTDSLVVKMISTPILNNHIGTICTKQ